MLPLPGRIVDQDVAFSKAVDDIANEPGNLGFGMLLATPGLTLAGLDQFPQMRGLAASCQDFAMVLLAGLVTQLAPTFGGRAPPWG